jgi:hypothetical protein
MEEGGPKEWKLQQLTGQNAANVQFSDYLVQGCRAMTEFGPQREPGGHMATGIDGGAAQKLIGAGVRKEDAKRCMK